MSVRRQVGAATLTWMFALFAARLVGALREAVIGRVLGGSGAADVYWTAFALPIGVHFLLGAGVLALVFIPLYAGHQARGEEERARFALETVGTALTVVIAGVVALLWGLAPTLVPWVAPGYTADQLELTVRLTRIVLPGQLFVVTGGLLSAALQARDQHLLPALAQVVANGTVVLIGLMLGPWLGAEGFAWGVLLGSVLGNFGLPALGVWRWGEPLRPRLSLSPDVRAYVRRSVPVLLALGLVALDEWLALRFASLGEAGLVTRLTYARFLMKAPVGILGMAVAAAVFPTLTTFVARGEVARARSVLWRSAGVLTLVAVLAQTVLTLLATPLATLLFGTTRFTPDELGQIGTLTGLLCLGLVPWCLQTLLLRGYHALSRPWTPALLALGVGFGAPTVYAAFFEALGAEGLGLASPVVMALYTALLALGLWLMPSATPSRTSRPRT